MTKQELHTRLSKYGQVYHITHEVSEKTTYRQDNQKEDSSHVSTKLIAYLDVKLDQVSDFYSEFGKQAELEKHVAREFEKFSRDIVLYKCIYVKVTI